MIGLAIGSLAVGRRPIRQRLAGLAAFVALANLPDWPLPGWGHDAYHVSHSLAVNLVLIAIAAGLLSRWLGWRVLVAGAAAWLSHLLLDSFYNHGLGVQIGSPAIDYRLNLPIPWLQTLDVANLLSWRNASVVVFELLTFGPFAIAALLASWRAEPGRETGDVSS